MMISLRVIKNMLVELEHSLKQQAHFYLLSYLLYWRYTGVVQHVLTDFCVLNFKLSSRIFYLLWILQVFFKNHEPTLFYCEEISLFLISPKRKTNVFLNTTVNVNNFLWYVRCAKSRGLHCMRTASFWVAIKLFE